MRLVLPKSERIPYQCEPGLSWISAIENTHVLQYRREQTAVITNIFIPDAIIKSPTTAKNTSLLNAYSKELQKKTVTTFAALIIVYYVKQHFPGL